jgi:hypothetical protein
MKPIIKNCVKITATGFVALLLLSLPLFWARWLSEVSIGSMIPDEYRRVSISPSGLVPPELENEPNIVKHSKVYADFSSKAGFDCLGIVDYFAAGIPNMPGARHAIVYYYDRKDDAWIYLDQKTGQIVCHYTYTERIPDNTMFPKKVQLYAGPEGIARSSDKALGRFIFPIVDARATPPLTLYDKKLHRFFTINFEKRIVTKGPELGKDDPHKPIQIGLLGKNPFFLYHLDWVGPQVKVAEKEEEKEEDEGYHSPGKFKPIVGRNYVDDAGRYLLVLDETGRIDLLDKETLEFAGTAGHLPAPQTFFPSKEGVTPQDLLAYNVLPLVFNTDDKYRGMFVASVSREGTAMVLAVFDEKGDLIKKEYSKATEHAGRDTVDIPSSEAAFSNASGAPAMTAAKYLLENLHPPVLSVVSFFSAYNFEAAAGYRALFILPNSFVAMKGRDISENIATTFPAALLIMLPSIILGIFLAWRVNKDATVVGLSENARLCWMIGIIAFGLSGYITYRLTRPRETLVTCANCGKLRRPDMDKCHRCGSKWHVPELTPPTWRVLDR